MVDLVKRPAHAAPSAEQMAADRDRAIELQLIMSGQFDSKIAEMKRLKGELDARQTVVDTVEQAERLLADARQEASDILEKASAGVESAGERLATLHTEIGIAIDVRDEALAETARRADEITQAAREAAAAALDSAEAEMLSITAQVSEAKRALAMVQADVDAKASELEALKQRIDAERRRMAEALGLTVS